MSDEGPRLCGCTWDGGPCDAHRALGVAWLRRIREEREGKGSVDTRPLRARDSTEVAGPDREADNSHGSSAQETPSGDVT